MSQSIAIFGRQPALGLAEVESIFGAEKVQPIGRGAAIIDVAPEDINIDRLGGSMKLGKLLTKLDFTDWNRLSDYVIEHVPKHTCCIAPGKVIFGISTYGVRTNQKAIERTSLSVKKAIRASDGRSVRVVPTKGTELNSAQVLHNKMTQAPLGMELLFVQDGSSTYLAQTFGVQNIDAYAARDQARPKRDARVGMLPPKLAQIIVNLSGHHVSAMPDDQARKVKSLGVNRLARILDPFCGTGVILQEALIMGFDAVGSDLEPRMVEYSEKNLKWLTDEYASKLHIAISGSPSLQVGDATELTWEQPIDRIACETYLGRPFANTPDNATLRQVMNDVNTIHKKFLQNVARQTKPGLRMTIAVPAWNIKGRFMHLSTLDHLEELGYNRLSFKHVDNKDLIYHREGQIVGRELITLVRK